MICVSIHEENAENCIRKLESLDFAEIRLDHGLYSDADLNKIFSSKKELIATCRSGEISDEDRFNTLEKAIRAGASYVDLDIDSDFSNIESISKLARKFMCRTIVSYHDFKETPDENGLKNLISECRLFSPDIVKIACFVNHIKDLLALLSLYKTTDNLIAIGMGEKGKVTRVVATFLGAPFTYASFSGDQETAPGQLPSDEMERIIKLLTP